MIDGLRLTISGDELRGLLDERIEDHERCVARWKREQARTPEEQTEDEPLLPEDMCEHEAERHEWRANVLGFIRDHIEAAEAYRLSEADLYVWRIAAGEAVGDRAGGIRRPHTRWIPARTTFEASRRRVSARAGDRRSPRSVTHLTPTGCLHQGSTVV